jgi:ribonucleoside-diphosphate reductase beta chain
LIKHKLSQRDVHKIIRSAVKVEKAFVTEALQTGLIGINHEMMNQYVEFVADRLSTQLGYERIYNATNPFPWMELISMQTKTNFFEKRVTQYFRSAAASGGVESDDGTGPAEMSYDCDGDF